MLAAPLQQKIDQTRMVIEDAFDQFDSGQIVIAWSGGKDSTLLLYLMREIAQARGQSTPLCLDIDQKDQFPEIEAFRDHLVSEWELDLHIVRNDDFLQHVDQLSDQVRLANLNSDNRQALEQIGYTDDQVVWQPDTPACNHLLKTLPINHYLSENHVAAMCTGIRWDEHGARENETYFSSREHPPHTRIHPLLHLRERDIWDATFALGIPYNDLYIRGYRSIGSRSGTVKSSDTPAWEQDLESTSERGGRSEEKEKMMEQLRAWGYM